MGQVEGGGGDGDVVAEDLQGEGGVASVAEIGGGSVVVTDQQVTSVFSGLHLAGVGDEQHGEEDKHELLH